MTRVSVIGIVGVPARYGGFETLVDNILISTSGSSECAVTVYCDRTAKEKPSRHRGARLVYLPFKANGISSILYDISGAILGLLKGTDVFLVLGVSGALVLPVLTKVFRKKVIVNIDGIEWRRQKWGRLARKYLKNAEYVACKCSHEVIADNLVIARYVRYVYGRRCSVIEYGGAVVGCPEVDLNREKVISNCLSICRIEPENNVSMILDSFRELVDVNMIVIGNWMSSEYGRELKTRYEELGGYELRDPVYESGELHSVRCSADIYLHGHSAGGTNPSLVEIMHYGIPVVAFDCAFNRVTTEGEALYFKSSSDLAKTIDMLRNDANMASTIGAKMREIAQRRYTWDRISQKYWTMVLESE